MDWHEAKQKTLASWLALRNSIGEAHPVDLLNEANLICPLCERAQQEQTADGEPADTVKCDYCPAMQQFGGCEEACSKFSARVAEHDWKSARAIADEFIRRLEGLELPAGAGGGRVSGPGERSI